MLAIRIFRVCSKPRHRVYIRKLSHIQEKTICDENNQCVISYNHIVQQNLEIKQTLVEIANKLKKLEIAHDKKIRDDKHSLAISLVVVIMLIILIVTENA
jgi:hypothetical protein